MKEGESESIPCQRHELKIRGNAEGSENSQLIFSGSTFMYSRSTVVA